MTQQSTFDPHIYINDLIDALGFAESSDVQKKELFDTLMEGLNWEIWQAVDEHVEPEVLEKLGKQFPDQEDPQVLFSEIVKNSPASQKAIIKALDDYAQEVLQGAVV